MKIDDPISISRYQYQETVYYIKILMGADGNNKHKWGERAQQKKICKQQHGGPVNDYP